MIEKSPTENDFVVNLDYSQPTSGRYLKFKIHILFTGFN